MALRIVKHGSQMSSSQMSTAVVGQTMEEPIKRKVMITRKQTELEQQIKHQARAKEQLARKMTAHDERLEKLNQKLSRHQENTKKAAEWFQENDYSLSSRSTSLPQITNAAAAGEATGRSKEATPHAKGWVDINKVIRALCAMEDYMRLRNYRVVDLFRSREVNMNNDDMLDTDELAHVLETMHLNLSKQDIRMVADYMDADGSGDIDINELSAALRWARRNSAPRDTMNQIARVVRTNPATDILMLTTRTAKRKAKGAEEAGRAQSRSQHA
jgi:hypothetical protein